MTGVLIFDFPNDFYWSLKVVGHLHSMNNCRSAWLYPSHPVPGCFNHCLENCLIQLKSSSLSETPSFKPNKLFLLVSKSSSPHGAFKKPSAFWTQISPRSDFIFLCVNVSTGKHGQLNSSSSAWSGSSPAFPFAVCKWQEHSVKWTVIYCTFERSSNSLNWT